MRPLADLPPADWSPLHHSAETGVGRIKNGELIRLAEREFDLFITSDRNLRYQQNLTGRQIAILELSTNKRRRIESAAAIFSNVVDAMAKNEFRSLFIP